MTDGIGLTNAQRAENVRQYIVILEKQLRGESKTILSKKTLIKKIKSAKESFEELSK